MPVQAKTIPYILARRDMMIQSRTGSGKTGAYLLPILQRIRVDQPNCQALILVPTRELALQVFKDAELLGGATGVRSVAVYGGTGYGAQLEAFKKGAHIVVGTPGRVLDHLLRRSLLLDQLQFLIFDEADRLLSMGFYPDMKRVQSYLPERRISTYMFSATFPPPVLRLAQQFLKNPGFINLSSDHIHVTDTEHVFYNVPRMDKDRSLIRIIEMENPSSTIIFCNTRERVHYACTILQRYGYDADELSSDLSQADRERVMRRIRNNELRFLVATDVASRGIDIPDLSHVILYEPPEDPEDYIHRAGRTGRAGASGVAISLVNTLERPELQKISRIFKIEFEERTLPTDEEVQQIVSERATALLEANLRSRDRLQIERMHRFSGLAQSLAQSEEDLDVLTMLLDDFYQSTFHAAPIGPTEEEAALVQKTPRSGKRHGSRRRGGHGRK